MKNELIEELKRQEFKNKLPASMTMYLTFIGLQDKDSKKGKVMENMIINNAPLHIEKRGEKTIFEIQLKKPLPQDAIDRIKRYKRFKVAIMTTDDPLPLTALSSVNLGCFRFLAWLNNAKLIKNNPLTFTGVWDNYRQHLLLPQR
jgi:hypothetical protein